MRRPAPFVGPILARALSDPGYEARWSAASRRRPSSPRLRCRCCASGSGYPTPSPSRPPPPGHSARRPSSGARRLRDAVLFAQQMWAFVDRPRAALRRPRGPAAAAEDPLPDPDRPRDRRRHACPTRALQRALMGPAEEVRPLDRALTFAHWAWFFEPHLVAASSSSPGITPASSAPRARWPLCFDLGCATYIAVPTAPPWWAAENGYTGDDRIHRRMLEVGEETWGRAWPRSTAPSTATRGRRCRRCTSARRCWQRSC